MISLQIFFLFVIVSIKYITCSHKNSIPITLSDYDYIMIEVGIGDSQDNKIKLIISSISSKFIVQNKNYFRNGYDPERSGTVINLPIGYRADHFIGNYKRDNVQIGEYFLPKVEIIVIHEGGVSDTYSGMIGFGFDHSNTIKNPSVFDQLCVMQKKVLTISLSPETDKHLLFLGDFSYFLIGKEKVYKTCSLKEKQWKCIIDSIYINMNDKIAHLKLNALIEFSTNSNKIYVSQKFWNILVNMIYIDLIKADLCEEISGYETKTISCRGNQKVNIEGKVGLIIGKYTISLDLLQLYKWKEGAKILQIAHKVSEPDQWTFGIPFLMQYTTIFNKDDFMLGFIKTNKINRSQVIKFNYPVLSLL